jgi:PilZ domain
MDRRLAERYQTNLAAIVTDIASPDRVASGQIVNVSQSGICATLSMRVAIGATVKVQIEDCKMFGHVIYCDDEPAFRTGIEIVRVLIGESDLSRLVNAILVEAMPNTPGVVVSTK